MNAVQRFLVNFNRQPLYPIGQVLDLDIEGLHTIVNRIWKKGRWQYEVDGLGLVSEREVTRIISNHGDLGAV